MIRVIRDRSLVNVAFSTPPPWLPRSTRRQWPPLSNMLPPVIVFSRHSAASPCRRTAVLRCHRTAAWQCRRMEVLQCLHTAALPCRRVNFRPVLGAVPLHSPPLRTKIHTGTSTFFYQIFLSKIHNNYIYICIYIDLSFKRTLKIYIFLGRLQQVV